MSNPQTPTASHLPAAGLLRRLAAMVYDSLLLAGLSFVYAGIFAVSLPNWLGEPAPLGDPAYSGWELLAFQLGWLLLIVVFFVYFWRHGGQTLGMRAWRLRLQTKGGGQPSYRQCLLRCLLAPLSLGLFGAGYIWALFDPEGQTVHDHLTDTEVIHVKKSS